MGGRKLDGYIYWCEDATHAGTLARRLKEADFSSKLHVAFVDPDGVVRWTR
ncbi:MAG: hypothetical protein ACTHU0_04385 [Kofleriaceae bacterium]